MLLITPLSLTMDVSTPVEIWYRFGTVHNFFLFCVVFLISKMKIRELKVVRILTLLETGRSQRNVARLGQVSRYAVQFVQRRYQETGSFSRRQGSGRKRETRDRDD